MRTKRTFASVKGDGSEGVLGSIFAIPWIVFLRVRRPRGCVGCFQGHFGARCAFAFGVAIS